MATSKKAPKYYNFENIRILFIEGFRVEELRQLCFEHPTFKPFYSHLPQNASLAELTHLIIDYARQKYLLDQLLAWAKEQNPARYEAHQPYDEPTIDSNIEPGVYINPGYEPSLPDPVKVLAHRVVLTSKLEYRRWADEFYIREESKILPLLASPYEDDTGQQREDLLQIIHSYNRLLILGEPGMGKTVAMERMVWETAQTDNLVIPIFVPLLFFRGDLLEAIRVALSETGELHFDDTRTVRAFLHQTRCLIMFDGLNEVPGQQRERIVDAIAHFLREFSRHRYVVTSRPQDELWKRLRVSGVIEVAVVVQRITDEQVRHYLIAHLNDQKGRDLYDRLNERLKGLSRTPLLLWMIKEAGLEGKELPGNRGGLFDLFVHRMLTRDEKLKFKLPWRVKKRALEHLALTLQQTHQLACKQDHAIEIIAKNENNYKLAKIIVDESLRHGLLQGEQQVRFLHQSIQEYFVGQKLCEIAEAERQFSPWQKASQRLRHRNVAAWARDDWWAESFVQMAGLTDDSSWLAREIAPVKPWLAYWCSIEGKPVDEKTQVIVESKTIALLRSKETEQRLKAVKELSRIKNPRTIEHLTKVLDDENIGVSNAAIQALVELGEPAVETLLTALHSNEHTRWAATRALGQIWGLIDLEKLGNSDKNVRLNAAEVLWKLEDTRVVEPLIAALRDRDKVVRQAAIVALGMLRNTQAVEPLIAVLKNRDKNLRQTVVMALGKIGDVRAVKHLIGILKEDDENVQRRSIQALGRIWQLPDLIQLGSDDPTIRLKAVERLGNLANPQVAEALLTALKDSHESVRWQASEALGKLRDTHVVELLITALRNDHEWVQSGATRALGKLGDFAINSLIVALKENDRDVQSRIIEALQEMGEVAVEPLITALNDNNLNVRLGAIDALGKLGDVRAVEALIVVLNDANRNVRSRAIEALEKLEDARAMESLIIFLKDNDASIRWKATKALRKLGNMKVVEPFIVALKDTNKDVRLEAARALGNWGDMRATKPLIASLKDNDKDVRLEVAKALEKLGDAVVEPLIAALKDRDREVRLTASELLGKLGDVRAVEPLIIAFKNSGEVEESIVRALGDLGDARATESLITAFKDGSWTVRLEAVEALGKLRDTQAVEILITALKSNDKWIQSKSVEALRRIGTPEALALVDDYERRKRHR